MHHQDPNWKPQLSGIHGCIYTNAKDIFIIIHCKGKGKAIPLQAWTGPEGSRRLRLPDFKTISS
jgi:hypothetical protein